MPEVTADNYGSLVLLETFLWHKHIPPGGEYWLDEGNRSSFFLAISLLWPSRSKRRRLGDGTQPAIPFVHKMLSAAHR
jgi:hypothetical protein